MSIRCSTRRSSILVLLLLAGCGAATALQSREMRASFGGTDIAVRDSGAVIVGKRQVGRIGDDGKLVDSRGRLLAWVHQDNVRLRGGIELPIEVDSEDNVFVPLAAQQEAGLKPMQYRIGPDGTMVRARGVDGVPSEGATSPEHRRILLLILLLTNNSMWEQN